MTRDPYEILGVGRTASESELRSAYRRLVRLHHPDHNGGSAESARRFEEIQEAYARVRERRASGRPDPGAPAEPSPPGLDAQLAEMERKLREASAARARAMRDARVAAAPDGERRPSDEELGYVKTDDSFTKIFDDAISELAQWFSERRKP